jgi:hypothetical protein
LIDQKKIIKLINEDKSNVKKFDKKDKIKLGLHIIQNN